MVGISLATYQLVFPFPSQKKFHHTKHTAKQGRCIAMADCIAMTHVVEHSKCGSKLCVDGGTHTDEETFEHDCSRSLSLHDHPYLSLSLFRGLCARS